MHDGLAVADYSRKDFEELAREVLQTKRDSVIELRNEEAIRHCAGTNVTLIWPKPGFSGQGGDDSGQQEAAPLPRFPFPRRLCLSES